MSRNARQRIAAAAEGGLPGLVGSWRLKHKQRGGGGGGRRNDKDDISHLFIPVPVKTFISFRKFCLESESLPVDLHIIISDIIQGAGHIHDIYPTFLKHAQKTFPHLICMDDLYKIADLSNPPNCDLIFQADLARPPAPTYKQDLSDLFDYKYSTDVDLVFQGAIFPVHRAILSVRCPYFQADLARPPAPTYKQDLSDLFDYKYSTDVDLVFQGAIFPVHRAILSVRCPYFQEQNSSTGDVGIWGWNEDGHTNVGRP
ncbi:ATP-dependent RNA helicase SUV3, mitochondrial [Chionoecetes opilio]|uniref:ATP-dependent RNA helicase SUV3, mitochondrial n=1 Tax=Chionoecetes opilio TaxID=41210 RepID=A0A8J4XRN7_CHIOP|nr:ATP-dependent RNA helicase SUV3, mitochondrial [Chionoecetes opilio]